MEEQNRLNGLQEEAALWPQEVELAADNSATGLLQDQWIVKPLTCETSIYPCKIYYLRAFYLYMAEDLKFQLREGGKKMWLFVVIIVLAIYVVKPKVIIFTMSLHYL